MDQQILVGFKPLLCLVCEDQALVAMTLADTFVDAGHSVGGPFYTCVAAELWLDENRPDIAVVDAVLADGTCHVIVRRLIEMGVPVVIFSGYRPNMPNSTQIQWLAKPASFEAVLQAALALAGSRPQ